MDLDKILRDCVKLFKDRDLITFQGSKRSDLTKTPDRVTCKFWMNKGCRFGKKCRFSHPANKKKRINKVISFLDSKTLNPILDGLSHDQLVQKLNL